MAIDNYYVADQFSLLSKLMDIHGENSFKTKSYAIAAFTIEKLPDALSALPTEKIFAIKGIGDAIGKKIVEILETGELRVLKEIIQKTPPGVIEMLHIKGLGPKKIATVWKEMELESVGELLYACNENRLLLYKGFGAKTQNNIRDTIEFYFRNQGRHLFAEIESYTMSIDQKLRETFTKEQFEITGEFRRQLEIIDRLEWVTTAPMPMLEFFFKENGFTASPVDGNQVVFKGSENIDICFHQAGAANFEAVLFKTSCSEEFLNSWKSQFGQEWQSGSSPEAIFAAAKTAFIPSGQREKKEIIQKAAAGPLPTPIQTSDIRSIIHSHSNWSDGVNTIGEMAKACVERGMEYLVISDHSKSAFYANGLNEERIREQHLYIDELNTKLAPFKIYKSVESDILNDGSLDYADDILSTFDLVIASVHSNLKMTEEKAMSRLLRAIENPFTTILGHMTGRLLLSRPGYPVNYEAIIDACFANKVVIELNAHPRRLDMDWRWIDRAIEKGVLISIDPDAHSTDGFNDIRYGVLAAQKAGVTKENNLSSYSLAAFEDFLLQYKAKQKKGV